MLISVICPTSDGREESLERCLNSYERTIANVKYELIVVRNRVTRGVAWNEGAAMAKGDILHFTADDIEAHPGWLPPAVEALQRGYLPAPRVLNADGSLQFCGEFIVERDDWSLCSFSHVPTMDIEQWRKLGPSLESHYFIDCWFGVKASRMGIETVLRRDFLLTQHVSDAPRADERFFLHDYKTYEKAISECV